ncbi:MAG TPA: chemotaxis protein CheW [Bryobacteraceae bacterium]|nr:chemotaxis protein CheW [Bryobacteraceae bacterium]
MTAQTQERTPDVRPEQRADPRAGKYLTFRLGKEEFGIQVLRVKEIMGIQDITAVPGTPAHLKGVLNLRGKIIPVVDLRLKFAFPDAPFTETTCIVVVQVIQEAETAMIGLIVDGVSEVLNLAAADIEDAPDFGEGVETPFVLGIAKFKGTVKILLRIEDVLTLQELRGLSELIQ